MYFFFSFMNENKSLEQDFVIKANYRLITLICSLKKLLKNYLIILGLLCKSYEYV